MPERVKKHILEQQTKISSDSARDIAEVYAENSCRCQHLERWLPHILDTTTLPDESLDTYRIENPIHALHLQSNAGAKSSVLYGDEQRRADGFWQQGNVGCGIVDTYIPKQAPPINQHYYTKRLKIEKKKEVTVKKEKEGSVAKQESTVTIKKEAVKKENTLSSHAPASSINSKPAPPSVPSSSVAPPPQTTSSSALVKLNPAALSTPTLTLGLSEERYHQLRRAEAQAVVQRRNVFPKRDKRKSTKKNKKRDSHVKASSDDGKQVFVIDSEAWEAEARRARDNVEGWMQHFRDCRLDYWASQSKSGPARPFGCFEEANQKPSCQKCSTNSALTDDEVMKCLDCGFIGCAPHSLASKSSKQHMIMHMLTSNHKFAVSCGKRNVIYCFGCGDVVEHDVFDRERERIDLEHSLPSWAWKAHPIQRSFDAFNFVSTRDHGIIWRGLVATYPSVVTRQHLTAAKMVLRRHHLYRNPTIAAPVGLYNLGNTCFMNGILQCLIHCPPLQNHFLKNLRHDHRTCRLFRKSAKSDGPKKSHAADRNNAGKSTTTSSKKTLKSCLACEMDLIFVQYYGSTIGHNCVAELGGKPVVEGEKGTPLIPSALLTELWKQPEMDHLKGYEQRDAHEFLQAFLDIVAKHSKAYEKSLGANLAAVNASSRYDGIPKPKKVTLDIVKHLFEGTLRSVSLCEDCGCKRSLQEPFINVSLPLSEDSMLRYTSRKMNVQHCLNHFTAPERLGDPIECPSCQKKTPTKKQQTFSRLPKILCLHLKRFDAARNKKITDFVSFPAFGLDMGPLLPHWREVTMGSAEEDEAAEKKKQSQNNNDDSDSNDDDTAYPQVLYDLYGTVNHRGTLNQGHYVSNVKVGTTWYHCNDAHISVSEESEVLKSDGAYMLFYIRR